MQDPSIAPSKKRRFAPAFKAAAVQQSYQPNSSAAAVAKLHGIRVALIYRWRREIKQRQDVPSDVMAKQFVQLPMSVAAAAPSLTSSASTEATTLHIECHRASKHLVVHAPLAVLATCLAWLNA
jgi:transposase-like protein